MTTFPLTEGGEAVGRREPLEGGAEEGEFSLRVGADPIAEKVVGEVVRQRG
jgi:hypothetical protein